MMTGLIISLAIISSWTVRGGLATAADDVGGVVVRAIGEAKHTAAERVVADVERLEHIRSLVSVKYPSAAACKLVLFAANGFDAALTGFAARRADVELVDLYRLYRGE